MALTDAGFLSEFPKIKSLEQVYAMEPKPVEWLIEGILPIGTALLVGPPKLGKSYFAMNLLQMISDSGAEYFYFAGEDGFNRLQRRAGQLGLTGRGYFLAGREHRLTKPKLEVEKMLVVRPTIKAIIIDTMEFILSRDGRSRDYEWWVNQISPWSDLAHKYSVSILMVHHTRKTNGLPDSSPFDAILGSQGISASFDTLLAMRKASDGKGATLNITGKDVEEQEFRLDKEPYGWSVAGLERLASLGATQDKVHSHIKSNPGLCWKEIKNDLEIHGGQLSTTLKKLVTNNIIEETEGVYHSLLLNTL